MPQVLPQVLVTVTNFPTMQTESACCFFSLWCQLLVCLHFFVTGFHWPFPVLTALEGYLHAPCRIHVG